MSKLNPDRAAATNETRTMWILKETLIKSGISGACAAFSSAVGDLQGGHAPLFSYYLRKR
jgi:hypothetical protein